MRESDCVSLEELEEAFERKDLQHFISILDRSKGPPLLLRVRAVCILEQIGEENSATLVQRTERGLPVR
jgi:hypothetical protein